MKSRLLIILYVLLTGVASAQTVDRAKLDAYFDALEKNDRWMGSVAILKDGQLVYTRAIGYSDVEKETKATPSTRYRIGSISKTFTSALTFKAIEEKKLKLTDKLSKWFPSITNASQISIDDLLSHRSGIHNFTNDDDFTQWCTQAKTEAEMTEIIRKGGSDFEPGSKSEYSNSNFVLLTYILEKIYGTSYVRLLADRITTPLRLNGIVAEGRIDGKVAAHSYGYIGKWEKAPETDLSVPSGAGAVVADATQLAGFYDALFDGKVVSEASLTQMKTLQEGYGKGLFTFPFNGRKGFGHTGGIDAFTSIAAHFDDGDVTIVRLSNGANIEENDISIVLLSAAYGLPFDIPSFEKRPVSETPKGHAGVYATPTLPIKITISERAGTFYAQATGQSEFPLEAQADGSFTFEPAHIKILFDLDKREMTLVQGGATLLFTKE
ncbi:MULTISPECIES: serine hydrolase [unclassified Flavobacterium]|uniref:serine hydrolase domain-containing protein n=1 Tax=unclassified Flavobacterium TaxID=196869 RepID=UPI001F12D3DC|nr:MULTISPECIES: serine hydrolase domain-containing protein [unclassified Flavobacterium]UMY65863.1 beta-lactamase family protein [Flavobacterium sp. HJ-32-4]